MADDLSPTIVFIGALRPSCQAPVPAHAAAPVLPSDSSLVELTVCRHHGQERAARSIRYAAARLIQTARLRLCHRLPQRRVQLLVNTSISAQSTAGGLIRAQSALTTAVTHLVPNAADEIDAIGTKRYEAQSGGEREIQRTMLELLNQLDGFDSMGDVKARPSAPNNRPALVFDVAALDIKAKVAWCLWEHVTT